MTFMNEVEDLNLNGNYLSRFPLSMFKNQPFLRTLKVNSNFLFALPSDLFDFTEDLITGYATGVGWTNVKIDYHPASVYDLA